MDKSENQSMQGGWGLRDGDGGVEEEDGFLITNFGFQPFFISFFLCTTIIEVTDYV